MFFLEEYSTKPQTEETEAKPEKIGFKIAVKKSYIEGRYNMVCTFNTKGLFRLSFLCLKKSLFFLLVAYS